MSVLFKTDIFLLGLSYCLSYCIEYNTFELFIHRNEARGIKALQNTILKLVISSILISTLLVMIIAIFRYSRFGETNSEQMIQLMCSEKKQLINEKLLNVEQSVNTIYNFIMEQMEDAEILIMNEEDLSKHIDSIKELMQTSVKYTDGAVTVYYRLNPELEGPKQGIWLVRSETGEFVEYDFIRYSSHKR